MLASLKAVPSVPCRSCCTRKGTDMCMTNVCVSNVCRVWLHLLDGVYERPRNVDLDVVSSSEPQIVLWRIYGQTQCKQKDGLDQSDMSPLSPLSPAPENELFSWPGPKTLHLYRTSQGFGFTLRHFIVYPPESAVHYSFEDEDNGTQGKQRNRLEPMDTIFVKQVKEGGSAHQAGLCTGDRIVKVNGESIIGKTYSQVIALIQNSETSLELCVMPKDEDILQLFSRDITALAYSKDAYFKGNEEYSGNAQNIPEPPLISYPGLNSRTSEMMLPEVPSALLGGQGVLSQETESCLNPDMGYHWETPVFQSPSVFLPLQVSKAQTVACVHSKNVGLPEVDLSESLECLSHLCTSTPNPKMHEDKTFNAASPEIPSSVCPISQTTLSCPPGRGMNLHYTPKRPSESAKFSILVPSCSPSHPDTTFTPHSLSAGGTPMHYIPKRQTPSHPDLTSVPSNRRGASTLFSPLVTTSTPCSPLHQNIDWKNYTTYKEYIDNKRLYTYGSRTIEERLDSLRAASFDDKTNASTVLAQNINEAQQKQKCVSHERQPESPKEPPLRSISQERLEAKEEVASRAWRRSASQDAIPLSTKSTHKPQTRSCDYLSRQGEHGVSLMDKRIYGRTETEDKTIICTKEEAGGCIQSGVLNKVKQSHRTMGGYSSLPRIISKSKVTDPIRSSRANSLSNAAASRFKLTTQTSILNDSYVAKALASLNLGATSTLATMKDQNISPLPCHKPLKGQPENHSEVIGSIVFPDHSKCLRTQQGNNLVVTNGSVPEGIEGAEATVMVVKRDKLKRSGPLPLRHPSYIQAVIEGVGGTKKIIEKPTHWIANNTTPDRYIRRLGEEPKPLGSRQLHDSLDSIPFIDEPSSPSADFEVACVPECADPPSPTSSSNVLLRQLSHNQEAMPFTLLDSDSGAKTERSKSYHEGMDTFRDDEHGSMIKHIAGLRGLIKAVDQSSEDSESRRNSLSDVFCETTKEGMLHFRQLSSDKSKRVGGNTRSWKQMFTVLRGHSLYLYKGRKEGQSPNLQTEEEPLQISIKACLIDISYSDTKRKNVLRLTTSDCDYLFQAEDRQEMLAWIRAIQENSNLDEKNALITSTDLINRKIREYNYLMSPSSSKTEASPRSSRQSLSIRHTLLGGKGENKTQSPHSPNKDQERKIIHKDESSSPKEKGPWTKGIPGLIRKPFEKKAVPGITFGVRLDDCPPAHTNRFVPLIVEVCCKLVEEKGLEYTGIYRVPGNNAAISSMQEELNRGVGEIDTHEDKWKDLNVISSLLKSFFRKLPEPLFTNEKYADFIEANRTEDPVERLKVLKRLLHELPDHHHETLKFLSAHLKTVAENSEKNKMEPRNLAIVFGPTLVRTSEDNMTHMVTHMPDQYKIVETLIQHYDWFFTDEGDDEPVTVVQMESAVETQPVPNIDHLLTNIGRTGTSAGEVSESPTSDSAKSKGSVGSGKDQCSRELVSSIFAAASRKRKKPNERKMQASSSDDDLDAVFLENELQIQKDVADNTSKPRTKNDRAESTDKNPKEHRNSFFMKKLLAQSLESRKSFNLISRTSGSSKGTASDPQSQMEEVTSDLGTMRSAASEFKNVSRIPSIAASSVPTGGSAVAEVSSITSDYSTTSSMTFLTGAESSVLSVDIQSHGGDEADDERSELISEGQQMETDSETDFYVVSRGGTMTPVLTRSITKKSEVILAGYVPATQYHRILPNHKHQILSSRQCLQQKTDSESSLDGPSGSVRKGERITRSEPSRLSRVLEAVKNGRSTGSLGSAFSSSHSQLEPSKRLSISDILKSRFRLSADDMFGISKHKNARKKEKRVHRRHTMGGQRDFKELAVINDWCEQGGTEKRAELSDADRLRPQKSREISIWDRISHEHWFTGSLRAGTKDSEVITGTDEDLSNPTSLASCQSSTDHLNCDETKCKGKTSVNLAIDAPPHKLSGAQVVCSQFYQCL